MTKSPRSESSNHLKNFAKFILWGFAFLFILLVIFSSFENWRGRKAWKASQENLQAKGLSLDWEEVLPTPIDDSKNLVLAPIMNGCFRSPGIDPIESWQGEPIFGKANEHAAQEAQELYAPRLPAREGDSFGFPISETESLNPRDDSQKVIFEKLDEIIKPYRNDLEKLREACARYPGSYIPGDYSIAAEAPLPEFDFIRSATRLLTAEALTALHQEQPELALENCQAMWRIANLNPQMPYLVNVLVSEVVARSHITEILYTGIAHDSFNAEHMPQIISICEDINIVSRLGMAYDLENRTAINSLELYTEDPIGISLMFGRTDTPLFLGAGGNWHYVDESQADLLWKLTPAEGWNLQMMARLVNFVTKYYSAFDVSKGTVNLKKLDEMFQEIKRLKRKDRFFDTLILMTLPAYQNVANMTVDTQRRADLLAITAQLVGEVYEGNKLPETIQHLDDAPTDPVTGELYNYQKTDNGFALSSPGHDNKPNTEDDLVIQWPADS